MSWVWLAAAIALAGGLALLEYRRARVAHRAARMLAVVALVAALGILWHAPGEEPALTLLTPGAPVAERSREAISLEQLPGPSAAFRNRAGVRLVGWGLLPCEWPASGTAEGVEFVPAPLPHEVVALDAPVEVGLGERYRVTGKVELAAAESVWAILEDPAGPRDSVRLMAEHPTFVLSDRPRAVGPASYRVRLRGLGRSGAADTLGVSVRAVAPPSILILDASPSFETAFLKRWLGERGARVTVRTSISRDRYRNERLNGAPALKRISTASLEGFDAILLDGGSFAGLTTAERQALRRAVAEEGLGLLLTADVGRLIGPGESGTEFATFRGLAHSESERGNPLVRPEWPDAPRRSRVAIEAEGVRLSGGEVLARDQTDRPLAVRQRLGAGWVGLTLLTAPSRWLLEGDSDLYASYWSLLLTAVARDTAVRVSIESDGPLRAHLPARLSLLFPRGGAAPEISVISPGGARDRVALARDPFDPRRWTGRYWPRSAGWHLLRISPDRSLPFRVSHRREWIGLEASARLSASLSRVPAAAQHPPGPGPLAWRLVSFLVLVAVSTWLWVERRLGV